MTKNGKGPDFEAIKPGQGANPKKRLYYLISLKFNEFYSQLFITNY